MLVWASGESLLGSENNLKENLLRKIFDSFSTGCIPQFNNGMRYKMFEMKQYYTLGSVGSNKRLIQRQFWNWEWNRFGIGIGFNVSLVSNVE